MKLWNSTDSVDKLIERFTIGKDNILDLELAKFDVIGSLAHAKMLHSIDLLRADELATIETELNKIKHDIESGNFSIQDGVEDIHSQIEFMLTERLGEAGKKIHTGRSRNDQVLLDLKLYYREKLQEIDQQLVSLIDKFIAKSKLHKEDLMPGYTHMQIGMISSFGMWFGSFAEALVDDVRLLRSTAKIIDQNPLGSAAGYGNSFPLDREMTTELLGFNDLCYNSMYAQFTRGKSELLLANTLSGICYTLNKFASDICLYCNQDVSLVKLPTSLTTGSSIMPHKKNPDVFELLRAKTSQLMSLPNQVMLICNNLISGYHRDFQQLKELVFPAIATMSDCILILTYCVTEIEVNKAAIEGDVYNSLYSVEEVNALVQNGMPFREAYLVVKEKIESNNFTPNKEITHTHTGSIGNLSLDKILNKLDS
jgi:argininosuccinate lyase